MRFKVTAILAAIIINPAIAQFPISFTSEYIDFNVDTNYFSVNGIYSFTNLQDKINISTIIFPFSEEAPLIDSIRIFNLNILKGIKYERLEHAIKFGFQSLPLDTVDINIFYRQKLKDKNTYIFKSTKSWGTPLKKAVYTLTVSKNIKIASLSFQPDSSSFNNSKRIYYWTKYNFMPDKEFDVIIDK